MEYRAHVRGGTAATGVVVKNVVAFASEPDPAARTSPPTAKRSGAMRGATTQRWMSVLPMLIVGGVGVISGGLVAAITGPTSWQHGSWVAAFLVLVVGVGQIGIASGQALLACGPSANGNMAAECGSFNVGCALIIGGTLIAAPPVVSAGSALLMSALVISTTEVRRADGPRSILVLYRTLLLVLLVSIPIGMGLAWVRH